MSRDHIGAFNVNSNLNFAKGIMLLDNCEGTCNWTKAGTGADPVLDYNSAAAFIGTNGMRIQTRSTSPAQYDVCSATKIIHLPVSGYMKFRAMCNFPDVSLVQQLSMMLYLYHLTDIWKAELRLTPNTPTMQYMNAAGGATAIADMALKVADGQWFELEVGVDVTEHEYVAAQFNGIEVALSKIGFYDADDTTFTGANLFLEIGSAGAAQATAYFDQIYCGEYPDI